MDLINDISQTKWERGKAAPMGISPFFTQILSYKRYYEPFSEQIRFV